MELEQKVAKRDGEIVQLREEVQRLQLTLQEAQQNTANHISRLQEQLASKMENIERLKAKLYSQQDYEKIKEELRILKEKRRASADCPLLSVREQNPRAVLDSEEDVLEDGADPSIAGVEIKREVETPSNSHPSTELVEYFSKLTQTSCEPSSRRATPSPCPRSPSPQDSLPYLSNKTDNTNNEDCGSLRMDSCGTDENGNGWSPGGDTLDGRFLEAVESQIETAEIAQQVKELLHKHKIGQHVFGKFVLGRLQGNVSEILARPKSWSKLTTRGKEPFLRMLHFLADEQNVLVLRIIQERLRGDLGPSSDSSSAGVCSSDMDSDDAIRKILEKAKKEQQSQNGGKKTWVQPVQSRRDVTHGDINMGKQSEDIIRHILQQASQEMQVQPDTEDQTRQNPEDLLMSSELQVKQEEEERGSLDHQLDHQPPDCDLLKVVSPNDFVRNIIRKVKSEIGAEVSSSASYEIHQSSTKPSPLVQESDLPFPYTNHTPYQGGGTRGEMELIGMKVSPEKEPTACGEVMHPVHLPSESSKENWQPPPALDGQQCVELFSQPLVDLHSGLETQQLMPQHPELDTLSVTRRVKEVLAENNLGQRLFGELVLGLTQGSVSDLLARPKAWRDLSMKGREPFLRMYFWLKDPQNVEYLKTMKSAGHRAHTKRPFSLLSCWSDSTSQEALLDGTAHHPGQFTTAKRPRVVLTSREKEVLNRTFQMEPYPSHHTTQRLAQQLGLQPSTVTNWFYNHRSRLRRTVQDEQSTSTDSSNSPCWDTQAWPCSDPNNPSSSTTPCTDTGLVTIKQEPSDAEISEVRVEGTDIYWDTKYVSKGVQSCNNLKVEEEEDQRIPSPQSEADDLIKDNPDGADHPAIILSGSSWSRTRLVQSPPEITGHKAGILTGQGASPLQSSTHI